MPKFGERSQRLLNQCHPDIQRVLNRAIKIMDFAVITGHRGKEEQNDLFHKGLSMKKWPESRHNSQPSEAVDVVPWPIDWEDTHRFSLLAGVIWACAELERVQFRWGGDWDSDTETTDQTFMDWGHFELAG